MPNTKTGYVGGGWSSDPMASYTQSFINLGKNVLSESSMDIFEEPQKILRRPATREALKEFFCENFMDENLDDPFVAMTGYPDDQRAMMEQQFENDATALLEHSISADYNPVVGMTFPVHKNILMNMVFDKGAIQKVVAESPSITLTMERRLLIDSKGNEIDMFLDQNKMTPAIDASNPVHEIELTLPETGATDVLNLCGGTKLDALSIKTHISHVLIDSMWVNEGEPLPDANNVLTNNGTRATAAEAGAKTNVWVPVNLEFKPGYNNEYDRTLTAKIDVNIRTSATAIGHISDQISGTMHKNKITVSSLTGTIKKVKLAAELDTSNAMLDTVSVKWDASTSLIEIPNAIPINVTVSPEEVKDLAALYQVNQLTKIMSMMKTAMANYKDDKILEFLNKSYETLSDRERFYDEFSFAPQGNYALDPVTWRYTMFMDVLSSEVTRMLQVLNDPNMVVTVFGDPDLIRKISPTTYTYETPSSIGPVELDYKRTVVSAGDKRIYQFIGSDKLRYSDKLIVILTPRNSDRMTYRIFDYQMYVSNEIRNSQNPALPAIHGFERWTIQQYQPTQGRFKILNRSGFKA
nr:MAG TPA: Structural protein [Caudoviricetes sp.]